MFTMLQALLRCKVPTRIGIRTLLYIACHVLDKASMSLLVLLSAASSGSEPNPPKWPASVHVFSPGDDGECATVAASIFKTNGGTDPVSNNGQFVSSRHALLFKPGSYSCAVPVGFYTQVRGFRTTMRPT